MKLGFSLFKYFPFGGLQRDFLRIAEECQRRGHTIHVFTMEWMGPSFPGVQLHLIPSNKWQNHRRALEFSDKVAQQIKSLAVDLAIGFNKMPNLDIYYAADGCYQARIKAQRSPFYRLLPRYQAWVELESAVFSAKNPTQIFILSSRQEQEYCDYYHTEKARLHLLPPGIRRPTNSPAGDSSTRSLLRKSFSAEHVILMVASSFKTKGLDRAIIGLSKLPPDLLAKTRLVVAGSDDPHYFSKLAKRLKVESRILFLGPREDIRDLMLASDFLLHPAYHDNTGTVILEALVAGLPVLTLDCCGYAYYVQKAQAGVVLASPFKQAKLNAQLVEMLSSPSFAKWRKNALAFTEQADIYRMPQAAVNLIEKIAEQRR